MKKILLLCAMLFALAANAQNVYRPYREFVYMVTVRCGDSVHTSYLSMWATDSAFEADASQRQLFYAYHDSYNKDSLAAVWPYKDRVESTGIIENDKKVWIHPPRSGEFALLEYYANISIVARSSVTSISWTSSCIFATRCPSSVLPIPTIYGCSENSTVRAGNGMRN